MSLEHLQPGMLFQELTRVRHNAVLAELACRGLGDLGAPMILFVLRHRKEAGQSVVQRQLSDVLRVSPATIAVSLKSLERGGYVERRSDAADARRKRIALTPKGVEAVALCETVFSKIDTRMLCGLDGEEIMRLTGYLNRMLENLRKEGRPDDLCERERSGC